MAIAGVIGSAVLSGLSKVIQSKLRGNHPKPEGAPPPPPPSSSGGMKKSLGNALSKIGLDTSKLAESKGSAKAFVKELFDKMHAQGKGNFDDDLKSLTSKLADNDSSLGSLKEKFAHLASALGGSSTASLQGLLQNLQSGTETRGTLISTAA